MHERLAVSISTADGGVYRWGPDEVNPENVPGGLSFSTVIPGGFESARITLARRIDAEFPDLNLFDDVRIYGPGNETAWEGRVAQLPRSHGSERTIQVGCVGWSSHLKDDPSFRAIYVDRDLGRWQPMSRARRIDVLASRDVIQDHAVEADAKSGLPALRQPADGTWAANGFQSEAWYDAGPGLTLGDIYHDWEHRGSGTFTGRLNGADDVDATNENVGTDRITTSPQTGTNTETTANGYRCAYFQLFFTTSTASDIDRYWTHREVTVWGGHGLTQRGTAPDDGLYASDVIAHALAEAAPLLSADIEPTSFVIPHIAFGAPTTAEVVIATANAYHLWEWGVYDGKRFFFREPDPERLTWEVRLSDGVELDLEGSSAEEVVNGVMVSYALPDGASRLAGPVGSGADVEDDTLVRPEVTNPINAHGIPRKWGDLQISFSTTDDGAVKLGGAWLSNQDLPQRRGSVSLAGSLAIHPTQGPRPAWAIRAGDFVRIADHPVDVARRVVQTSYDHASQSVTLSVDNAASRIEPILERIGVFSG